MSFRSWYRIGASIVCFVLVMAARPVIAAELWFEPQESSIGTSSDFFVAINMTVTEPVNAVQVAVVVPPNLEINDTFDGNSIINFWVDPPTWDPAKRRLTFSGILPGGFVGQNSRLLLLKIKALDAVTSTLRFDKEQTVAFLHDEAADVAPILLRALTLPVVVGKDNLPLTLPDNDPPESFVPTVFHTPTLYGNQWMVAFATQDKGVGLHHYEMAEGSTKDSHSAGLVWHSAQSPAFISDQTRQGYIFIKAIDKAGNERVAVVSPPVDPPSFYRHWQLWCMLTAVLFGLLFLFVKKMWPAHHSQR